MADPIETLLEGIAAMKASDKRLEQVLKLIDEKEQSEAAIARVRALLEPAPDGAVFAILRGSGYNERWQAVLPRDALEAALDQPAQQQGDNP